MTRWRTLAGLFAALALFAGDALTEPCQDLRVAPERRSSP